MDLGATLCTRTRPACTVCPMNEGCVAAREGRQAALPGVKQRRERKAREAVLLIAESGEDAERSVLLERRPASGIWGGLWSPPEFESESEALAWCRRELGALESSEALAPIDHAFTHFDLRLNPLRVRCTAGVAGAGMGTAGTESGGSAGVREGDGRLWYALEAPPKVGLPQPIHAALGAAAQWGARIALNFRHGANRKLCVVEARGRGPRLFAVSRGSRQADLRHVSKEAWAQWVAHQTMLINENRLTPIEPKARAFLVKEMEKFFFGEGSEKPKEFVPK